MSETFGFSEERSEYLGYEPVEIGVGGAFDVERFTTDIVNGFVIEENGDIGVFEERVSGENGVVWLNYRCGDLW